MDRLISVTTYNSPFITQKMLSVIIPIYNESLNIHLLHERLTKVVSKLTTTYELIFINDGSKDNSLELVKELSLKDKQVKFIDLSRNFGHQIAVSAGLDYCKGDTVVIIDADLQDPPELIEPMWEKLKEGYQVVYAKRRARAGEGYLKKLTAKTFYRLLSKITSFPIPVDTGDFRIMDKKVVEGLRQMKENHKFLRGQIAWIGYKQTYVEYDRAERNAGVTGYSYKKMINLALNGVTAFSNVPIKFVTISGFVVSAIAFLMIIYSFIAKYIIEDGYVDGWSSIMVGIMFLGGVQLISMGIIGEYISRINTDVKNRPLYFVAETNTEAENKISKE